MTTVPGPSLAELTRRALVGARFMRQALREVFVLLGADVRSDVPSTDDLISAHRYWEEQVDLMLLPNVLDALNLGTDVVRQYLDQEHTVPAVTNPYVELYLQTTRNRLTGISGMVWLAARDELVAGLREGEDVKALRTRVTNATGIVGPRAETIVRTEVNGAMNAGSLIEMRQIGIPFTKTWLATKGPRTRESHAKANGQKVDGDKKFMVGGWPMDRPHDPSAPPEETENCRCTLTYEIPTENALRKKAKKQEQGVVNNLIDLLTAGPAFHNAPGDHPMGHVASGDVAWGVVPHVSDSATTLYTDGAAEIGNEWLRGSELDVTDTGYRSRDVKSMIFQLDDHFASASPVTEDVETWRGTSFVSSVTKGAIGSEFTDQGFISTSTRNSVAREYGATGTDGALIRVITPKGFRAIGVHSADQEIVLPRNTRFKVTADGHGDDGVRQLDVRVIRQGGYTWDAGAT